MNIICAGFLSRCRLFPSSKILIFNIGRVIDSWRLADLTASGPKEEVSSTMTQRLSSCGSMRKINSESFPWSQVLTSMPSSSASLAQANTLRRSPSSPTIAILVSSLHALLTSELLSALQCTSSFPSCRNKWKSLKPSPLSLTSRSEESTENTPSPLMAPTTSLTSADSVAQRETLFKTCTTVSRP